MKSRWENLVALSENHAATPAERAAANRILQKMLEAGEARRLTLDVIEAWDLALLTAVCRKHAVRMSDHDALTQLDGDEAQLDRALTDYLVARAKLERLVTSTVAGFIARTFPEGTRKSDGPVEVDVGVARAAFASGGDPIETPKALIRGPEVKKIRG
jgi:hypothetical protein